MMEKRQNIFENYLKRLLVLKYLMQEAHIRTGADHQRSKIGRSYEQSNQNP